MENKIKDIKSQYEKLEQEYRSLNLKYGEEQHNLLEVERNYRSVVREKDKIDIEIRSIERKNDKDECEYVEKNRKKLLRKIIIISASICASLILIGNSAVARYNYDYFINNIEFYSIGLIGIPALVSNLSLLCYLPFIDSHTNKLKTKYKETEEYKNYERILNEEKEHKKEIEQELSQKSEKCKEVEKQKWNVYNDIETKKKELEDFVKNAFNIMFNSPIEENICEEKETKIVKTRKLNNL